METLPCFFVVLAAGVQHLICRLWKKNQRSISWMTDILWLLFTAPQTRECVKNGLKYTKNCNISLTFCDSWFTNNENNNVQNGGSTETHCLYFSLYKKQHSPSTTSHNAPQFHLPFCHPTIMLSAGGCPGDVLLSVFAMDLFGIGHCDGKISLLWALKEDIM